MNIIHLFSLEPADPRLLTLSNLHTLRRVKRFAGIKLLRRNETVLLHAKEAEKLPDFADRDILICQIHGKNEASKLKSALGKKYPADHPVYFVRGKCSRCLVVPLKKMDKLPFAGDLTNIYLPSAYGHGVAGLLRVMRLLRSKKGCPWDREQTHYSLKPYLLEETYEVLAAIDSGNEQDLCEELGDLFLQIIFHCQIAREKGCFSFYDTVAAITEKLIRRHPHVFASGSAKTAGEVNSTWQQIKRKEKKEDTNTIFTLEKYLPALLRGQKLQRQASSVGFDWPKAQGAWDKVEEELKELKDAYNQKNQAKIEEELGDLLFAIVNVARFLDVDAEQALSGSTAKFYRRLRYIEEKAYADGGGIFDYSLSKLDEWWEEAKSHLDKEKNLTNRQEL